MTPLGRRGELAPFAGVGVEVDGRVGGREDVIGATGEEHHVAVGAVPSEAQVGVAAEREHLMAGAVVQRQAELCP